MDTIEGRTVPPGEEEEVLEVPPKDTLKIKEGEAPEEKGGEKTVPLYEGEIEEYKGKTAEDLAKMLSDSRKTIGRQGQELGKLKDDLALEKRMAELEAKNLPPTEVEKPPDPFEGREDGDFIRVGEVKEFMSEAFEAKDKKDKASQTQRLTGLASAAHEDGKSRAMKGKLFEGIEKEVEDFVYSNFKPWVDQGYDVTSYLRDTETWRKAARNVRFNRGEYDFLVEEKEAQAAAGPEPMSPYLGEVPGGHVQNAPGIEEVKLDRKGKFIVDKFGLTEEEARDGVLALRRDRRGGL